LTPVNLSKTVKVSLTGVVDTGKDLFNALPVSLIPAKNRNNQISPRIFEKN
jgi:hypothetical protein